MLFPTAMRLASMRRSIRNLLASGGLVASAVRMAPGCCGGYPALVTEEQLIDPRGPFAALVAQCRAVDTDCAKLCAKVFFPEEEDATLRIMGCMLTDRSPSESLVRVDYPNEPCIAGRRPPGLIAPTPTTGDPVAQWLAEVAHLEAASVPAFVQLATELVVHGAPPPLVAAALRAADDEVRHAWVMTALARAAGAEPPPVEQAATTVRDLPAIALDNAVEGCVREAFAAACAAHQAGAAHDPTLRAALAAIAVDEHRHAALSRAIDAWTSSRIGPATRARRVRAQADAVDALWVAADAPPAGADQLGWPSPRRARALLIGLAA